VRSKVGMMSIQRIPFEDWVRQRQEQEVREMDRGEGDPLPASKPKKKRHFEKKMRRDEGATA
jgi:hypothetical protein